MLWGSFLMKKLLKIVICGTRKQCTGVLFTVEKSNVAVEKKKKKVKEQLSAQSEQALSVSGVRKFIWHIAIFKYEDFWCKIYY